MYYKEEKTITQKFIILGAVNSSTIAFHNLFKLTRKIITAQNIHEYLSTVLNGFIEHCKYKNR